MLRFIASLLLALFVAGHALAAGADHTRFALTVPMLQQYRAAALELKKLENTKKEKAKEEDDEDDDDKSVEDIARELDATPGVKPVLARNGFTSQSFALTTLALVHASMYLSMEPSMDKKKAASLLASYPKETQANIELLRKNGNLLR